MQSASAVSASAALMQLLAPESGPSNAQKIRECVLGFIMASSITTSELYRVYLRKFSDEIMKKKKIPIKDIEALYKIIPGLVTQLITKELKKTRSIIIGQIQIEGMTEEECDIIDRFNINELEKSIFHMWKYCFTQRITRYLNNIPKLMKSSENLVEQHAILSGITSELYSHIEKKYHEERSKVLDRIIMLDEHRYILNDEIHKMMNKVIDESYRCITAFIVEDLD